jgi:hypothetical protein
MGLPFAFPLARKHDFTAVEHPFEAELSFTTCVTPNTADKPLGWMSEKDWEETVVVLKQYGGVTSPLEAEQLYTNEFVPAGDEFIPPQTGPDKT